MKYLFLFFIFFNSYAYADLFDNVLNVTELELADKIEEAQRNIKAPLKTRGSNTNIFCDNAPRTAIIFSSSKVAAKSTGSGILINDGFIITNYHVIANDDSTFINPVTMVGFCTCSKFNENESMPKIRAEVLSYSKINDLALLKVNASTTKHIKPIENLEQSQIEFNKMIPGEKVHVIGNPLSQYCSYGSGEVSQIRSNYEWSYDEFYKDLKAEVIQTNAPILSGNSGGPMFNKGGNLIGINTFVYEDKLTLNFAVSINEVVSFISNADRIKDIPLKEGTCEYIKNTPVIDEQDTRILKKWDKDCDGYYERTDIDFDKDKIFDLLVIDKNKNIKPDLFISCSDEICSDLIYEYDNDENEIIEKVCYDYGADASIDKCVKKSNS